MRTLFGLEISAAGQYLIAFIIIFLLLAIFAVVLRKITGSRMKLTGGGTRARQPRLGVVDIFDLDRQRQLVLVRRDNVEHLVMIGGPNDVVVETAIVRSGAGRVAAPSPASASAAEALERALQPELPLERRAEPSRAPDMPQRPAMEPPASRVEPKPVEPKAAEPKPEQPKAPPIQPPRPPEMRKAFEPKAPEPVKPAPEPARPAARLEPEIKTEFRPEPRMPAPPAPPSSEPAAPTLKSDDPRLTEMARQLEEALKKPFSAVRPATRTAEPVARPEPKAPLPPPPVLKPPVAPMPPAPPALKPTLDDAPVRTTAPLPPRPAMPAPPDVRPASPPAPAPKAETRPEPESKPEAAPAPKPEAKAPEPKAPELDPFSPEAIEAEFARLLGRSTKSE